MSDELIIRGSRKKAILLLLLLVCLAPGSVWLTNQSPGIGWLVLVCCGLGIPVSLQMALRNANAIRLNKEGSCIVAMLGPTTYKWTEVEAFELRSASGGRFIAIQLSDQYAKQKFGRLLGLVAAAMGGVIGDSYVVSLEEICETLNDWKDRYGESGA